MSATHSALRRCQSLALTIAIFVDNVLFTAEQFDCEAAAPMLVRPPIYSLF